MRAVPVRLTVAALLLAASGVATPVLAAGSAPCGNAAGTRLVELGTKAAPVATPGTPAYRSSTPVTLLVELPTTEGSPTAADVTVELSWSSATASLSDFDLRVTAPDGSVQDSLATNAIDGPVESVTVPAVGRCARIGVAVRNFAGLPTEALTLTTTATAVEE